jgi:hypothetical protein
MKLEHTNGETVNTDNLPDVDALLMEASKALHEQFAKYNRQLLLVGEMKSTEDKSSSDGCVFFHVGEPGIEKNPEVFNKAIGRYYERINGYVRMMSNHSLGIGRIPPPIVEP